MNTRYDYRDKFDIQPVSDSVMIYHNKYYVLKKCRVGGMGLDGVARVLMGWRLLE